MQPNTLSIHFSVRDNDEDRIADQGKVIVPKTRGWRDLVPLVREHLKMLFKGGKDDR
jgi:hypothetical protein